jgi:glycosyltransferase involved in cell wall biosynthesis
MKPDISNDKLRICILSQYPPQTGGIAVHTRMLAEGLAEKGDIVSVITYGKSGRVGRSGLNVYETGGPDVFFLRGLCFSISAMMKLSGMIARGEIDIVHAHPIYPAGLAALAARKLARRNVPVVMTSHGSDLMKYTSAPVLGCVVRKIAKSADALICVSDFIRNRALEMGISRSCTVRNGIEAAELPKRAKGGNGKTVTFVGALIPQKGPDIFIGAAREVLKELPDTKFIVIGDGPMRKRLEKSAPESMEFMGRISRKKSLAMVASSDILAVTSRSEGFGMAALEALVMGTPVAALPAGALAEVLPKEFLASNVAPAIISELKTGRLSMLAKRTGPRLAERFSVSKMVRGTKNVYMGVLNEKN